jgi:hypothetical protein
MDGATDGATLPDGACVAGAYKHGGGCVCLVSMPSVCGEACVDLTTDDDNCGACGRACAPTSACNAGACGPVKNVVPAAPGCEEINLAVGPSALYWTDRGHGTVMSLPLAGGAPTTIASQETSPWLIAVGAADVFWVDVVSVTPLADAGDAHASTTATIRAAALGGGAPRDLVTETNFNGGVRGLVASEDGRTLYYSADTAVRAVPVAGGPAFDVGREENTGETNVPTALARDGNLIAFTMDLSGILDVITVAAGAVATCGKPDPASLPTSPTQLYTDCVRAVRGGPELLHTGLVFRSDGVYWAEGGEVMVHRPPDGGTLALDGSATVSEFTGSKSQIAITTNVTDVTALGGGPDALFFGEDGLIEKAPYVEGSTTVVVARGQKAPSSIAVAASAVFWSSPDDCAINSAAP